MKECHINELIKSSINEDIIARNFKSLQADSWEYLLYSLDDSSRRNDGRLRDNILKRYQHLDHGGWWCSGIDLKTMQPSEWGCFKPDIPKIINGKPIKYEHPPNAPTGIFALDVSKPIFSQISNKTLDEVENLNFWQWIIDNPVPIIVTEGAKKAACLLSQGYVALALPGIWNGVKDGVIIPELQILSETARQWTVAFDEEVKWTTQNDVFRATKKLGDYLLRFNESSEVFVMKWEAEEGKGIDDLVRLQGIGRLAEVYEERLGFDEYLDKYGSVKYLKRPQLLEFTIRTLGKRLAYNEMTTRIELDGKPLNIDDSIIFQFIEDYRIQASKDALYGCLLYVAKKNSYHPVEKYLTECSKLDPIRIDNLSSRYFGTSEPLYDYFVQQWLIAAVARGLEPGCKTDFALILQSANQGIGKSTFFRVLGGEWYDNSFGSNIDSTKGLMTLHKSWIQEWDEFDRVSSKSDFDVIKAFLTRTNDEFVPPYGRESLPHPRRCILSGTINKGEFLRDPTGARRFLVVPIADGVRVDNDRLTQERDRIWAGAVQAYLEGKRKGVDAWVLPSEIEAKVSELNKAYSVSDEWEDAIECYLDDKDKVSITEILEKVFAIEPGKQDRSLQMRVAIALTKLHWKKTGRGLDDEGRRRTLWTPINAIPQAIPQEKVWQELETSTDKTYSDNNTENPKPYPEGMAEVWHEVWLPQNEQPTDVSEQEAIPTIPTNPNFPRKSSEQPKTVSEDLEDDQELHIGDRVIHEISKRTGRVIWLNRTKEECQVNFDDGLSSDQVLFTRYMRRIKVHVNE